MSGWTRLKVEELAAPTPNALATGPFGSSISSKFFVERGVPVIRGSNLSENVGLRLSDENLVFLEPEKAATFSRSEVRRGDLVFTCWGTIGQVGLVDQRAGFERYIVSNKQMKLTPDPSKADSLFLYFAFSSPMVMAAIQGQTIGSSVPGFNLGQLRNIELDLPPLDEQRRIAAVLGALDDKIELNRRMNRTLEEMAQAIFKSWFIDFDGHDDLVDSEVGTVPRGWEVKAIGEVFGLAYGKSLPAARREPGPFPVYGSGGVTGTHRECLVNGPGVVVGRKGSVGTLYWEDGGFFPIDTTFFVEAPSKPWLAWAFHTLGTIDMQRLGADSAVPGVNRNAVLAQRRCVPPDRVAEQFWSVTSPLLERRTACDREVATLVDLRDTLLPKLVSGELRVPEAEAAVSEVL